MSDLLNDLPEETCPEIGTPMEPAVETEGTLAAPVAGKSKISKKKLAIIAAVAVVVIVVVVLLLIPPKFERVKSECVQIAGMVTGRDDYFTIDTKPDRAMFYSQEAALEAIQYANEAFGFNGSVYSKMLKTNALMGRQSAENSDYRVSWTYHPDDGLEVTYEKK